jgi:integrase
MGRIVLTEAKCLALKPGPKRRIIPDALAPGLILQLTPQGHRSFMLAARWPGGRHRVRRLLGEVGVLSLDLARATAREWLALLAQGRDPQLELTERRRQASAEPALTFAAVADAYIADRLRGKRQGARSANEIRTELVARWGERPLAAITRGDVIQLVDDLKQRARRTVGNRATGAFARIMFSHCRSLFNWAAMRYELPRSPCDRLRPSALGLTARLRERVLSDREIAALWRACDTLGYPFGCFIQTLLFSGCRRSEASAARAGEMDFSAKLWIIPASRFKSGSEHRVPLSNDLLTLLASLPRFQSGDHIFTTTFGRLPIRGFSKAMTRLLRLMRAELGDDLPNFTLHDIRRTVRTRLSELRVPELIAEAVIGHAPRGLARIYNQHRFADEIREALEAWHQRLRGIVSPPPENVVALRA